MTEYKRILLGIEKQKKWIQYAYLTTYYIPNIQNIHQEYADALRTIPDELTDNEKRLAILNAILEIPAHD